MVRMSTFFKAMALVAIMFGVSYNAEAQLGGMLNKAKNKAVQQIQHNQSQTDKTQDGKSQQQNSNTQTQNSKPQIAKQQQSLSPVDKAALEKMSKFETADDYNFHVATTVTKESAPEDIVRACL
ncbi:MAG: hypothetical protein J6W06_09405, partial [Bacteroidales bacterium]|nr:hypothetical protein [Bacteroidales bacterium]